MDANAIFSLILKGITVASALVAAGQSAAPALNALYKLATGAQDGTVTQEEMDATDALLDAQLAEFNVPMVRPPA